MRKKTVTVADVAERAGVSLGTVSKALNGRGQLRRETRERVLQAARELNFQPNALAQGLLTGRTFTVGLISSDHYGRFTVPILTGAEDALGPGEISMLLCESREDPIRERHYIRTLLARRVDGIIITGRSSDPRPTIGRDLPVPVVYALAQSDHADDLSVIPDDEGGARLAVEHLLETGRRAVAVVAGPARHIASRHRAAGALAVMARAGLGCAVGGPMYGEWSERWGRQAARRIVDSGERVDAVFCASDQIARGLTDELRDARVRCPEDIAVVGVDNWDVMAEAARPPLTTIDLNLREVGRRAATRLLSALDGSPLPTGVELVGCRLVVRGSTVA